MPIYLHPSVPMQVVMDAYYKDYIKDYPMVVRAAWGFTVETATVAIRMILSGLFQEHPKLKIILGHLGETLAVPGLAHRSGAGAAGAEVDELPRRVLQEFLCHHVAASSPIRRCFAR